MNSEPQSTASFSPARRLRAALNTLLSLGALTAIVVMANYLAGRHHQRYQWTGDARFELSPPTRRVLDGITNEVTAIVLFDRDHVLFPSVYGLLTEYAYACPRLKVEHVNYRRDPGRAEYLAARFQLASSEADLVIFESGPRFMIVRAAELSEYNLASLLAGSKEVTRTAFKGEPLFTSKLAAVLDARQQLACFLRGHGEHDPASDDKLLGYSRFAGLLRQKGIESRPLELTGAQEVPADCQLLVLGGPRTRLDPTELEKIHRYLQRGGRMLALLSFYQARRERTGVEELLGGWGIQVGDNYVLDPANTIRGNDLIVSNFAAHPIMSPLRDRRVHLLLARSVLPRATPGAAAGARPQPLFSSGVEGYTASGITDAGVPKPNPERDVRGPVPLAVAAERGGIQGLGADLAAARIVVVGESLFLGNEMIVSAANLEFASLAVNWLLDRPQDLAGLAARPLLEYRIALTPGELVRVRWLLLVVLPGAILLAGGLVWWRRRA
jgi:hypothetical protein